MIRTSLDSYDVMPPDMIKYLRHYGMHFNKKLFEYAIECMRKANSSTGKVVKSVTKEEVDNMLRAKNVTIKNNIMHDAAYVANMCYADFYGSSIEDDAHVCKYIKDVIDDVDAYDGIVFNRWYADMCRKGMPIDWEEMI